MNEPLGPSLRQILWTTIKQTFVVSWTRVQVLIIKRLRSTWKTKKEKVKPMDHILYDYNMNIFTSPIQEWFLMPFMTFMFLIRCVDLKEILTSGSTLLYQENFNCQGIGFKYGYCSKRPF